MNWPQPTDYFEAVQNPSQNFTDPELRQGQAAVTALGLPRACSGSFADVYEFNCPGGKTWAVKCFTRHVPDLQERYRKLAEALRVRRLPFTVEFDFLARGVLVRGEWFPVLKMQWVQGQPLNHFVRDSLDNRGRLRRLVDIWARMAAQLRKAGIAHADLQHGNVLVVPKDDGQSGRVTLIDYDGMYVPSLAGSPSGEVGHPAYQHRQRLTEGGWSPALDCFSHLVVCCALRALAVKGAALWDRHDSGDNLLFREDDLKDPSGSALFRELWRLPDEEARHLVGQLALTCLGALADVPPLDDVLYRRLTDGEAARVDDLLAAPVPVPVARPAVTPPESDPVIPLVQSVRALVAGQSVAAPPRPDVAPFRPPEEIWGGWIPPVTELPPPPPDLGSRPRPAPSAWTAPCRKCRARILPLAVRCPACGAVPISRAVVLAVSFILCPALSFLVHPVFLAGSFLALPLGARWLADAFAAPSAHDIRGARVEPWLLAGVVLAVVYLFVLGVRLGVSHRQPPPARQSGHGPPAFVRHDVKRSRTGLQR